MTIFDINTPARIPIPQGIHYIKKDKASGEYYLEFDKLIFEVPKKLYGKMEQHAKHFWKTFSTEPGPMGVLLTGNSGSGKTELGKLLSNMGVTSGIPVVTVTEIKADLELIHFINRLDSCVIMLDEFGKYFNLQLQDKMLTMLAGLDKVNKLFIMTENEITYISPLIRNRPGRALYHIDYTRVPDAVIEEYCSDYGVEQEFYNDMMEKYRESTEFSFDHLQALVKEHRRNTDMTFDDMLEILNLKLLIKPISLTVTRVTKMDDNSDVKIGESTIDKKIFLKGRMLWVRLLEGNDEIRLTKAHIKDITDEEIICEYNGKYRIILTIGGNYNSDGGIPRGLF